MIIIRKGYRCDNGSPFAFYIVMTKKEKPYLFSENL